jgi:hypothetical protein
VFGKAEPVVPGVVAADVEIRGNHVSKSLAWMRSGPPGRPRWATAGLLELRNARRVLVDGNLFEQRWQDGATDPAIRFTSGRSAEAAALLPLEDVTFSNNLVRRVDAAIAVVGGGAPPGAVTRRIAILNNLFYEIGGAVWGGEGTLFRVVDGTEDVVVEHNTASHGGSTLVAVGAPHIRFVFRNNITVPAAGRLIGAGAGREPGTLKSHFPRANIARNVMAGVDPAAYPPDNFFPASLDQVGFLDAGRNDYRLDPASPYRSAGTDGKDLGVDYAEFLATRGVLPALPLPVPRPSRDSSPGAVVAELRPQLQDARP